MTTTITPQALPPPPYTPDQDSLYRWLYQLYTNVTNITGLASTSADATELNYNDGAIAGTVVANKTVVVDSNKRIDTLDITTPKFQGSTNTATGTEVSALHGTGITSADISMLHNNYNGVHLANFAIGLEAANVINVAVTLYNALPDQLVIIANITGYLSDNSDGSNYIATAPSGTVAIGTNGALYDIGGNKKVFQFISNSQGQFDINITEAGAKTLYLVLIMPYGKLLVSNAITFV